MSFRRGDVVLLRRAGGQRHAGRAALIWRVDGDDIRFLLIVGVRSFDRGQKHRAEIDMDPKEAWSLGLPMTCPVLICTHENKLDVARLPSREPVGRASDALMFIATQTVAREIQSRQTEDRLSYRPKLSYAIEMTAPR